MQTLCYKGNPMFTNYWKYIYIYIELDAFLVRHTRFELSLPP